eukprot:12924026-Prorocentrum_lima.AAC.1
MIHGFSCLRTVFAQCFNVEVDFHHGFSVERDSGKRAWITQRCKPQMLFGDVLPLAANDWKALDEVSNVVRQLPDVTFHLA